MYTAQNVVETLVLNNNSIRIILVILSDKPSRNAILAAMHYKLINKNNNIRRSVKSFGIILCTQVHVYLMLHLMRYYDFNSTVTYCFPSIISTIHSSIPSHVGTMCIFFSIVFRVHVDTLVTLQ